MEKDKLFWSQWNRYIAADSLLNSSKFRHLDRLDLGLIGLGFKEVGPCSVLWMRGRTKRGTNQPIEIKAYWILVIPYRGVHVTVSTETFPEDILWRSLPLGWIKKADQHARNGELGACIEAVKWASEAALLELQKK